MDISRLRARLKVAEGFRGHPYDDRTGVRVRAPAGRLTIGYGRNLDDVPLTTDEADFLLGQDIGRAIRQVDDQLSWWRQQDDVRQNALLELAFNLGVATLAQFGRMLAAWKRGDYEVAAAELLASRYAQQVGQRAVEVASMIDRGEWPSPHEGDR